MVPGGIGEVPEPQLRFSFVVPIYRDADLADAFCQAFERAFQEYLETPSIERHVELIFVNDDASVATEATLRAVCGRYGFAKLINLSRNFGQHVALSCGYRHAIGQYVGMLNVDMEDPPDQIPRLIDELISSEADIAYCVRDGRKAAGHVRWTSLGFNWALNRATGYDVPLNVGTLRVMTRQAVEEFNALQERGRYIPGLEMWLGMRPVYVPITQQQRSAGKSSYSFRRRLSMAFEAIISFSDLPLRFVVMVGTAIAVLGFALMFGLIVAKLFVGDYRPGYTSTLSAVVLVGGIQILVIGVASLYIGRILTETQRRPLYVIRNTFRLEPHDHHDQWRDDSRSDRARRVHRHSERPVEGRRG